MRDIGRKDLGGKGRKRGREGGRGGRICKVVKIEASFVTPLTLRGRNKLIFAVKIRNY